MEHLGMRVTAAAVKEDDKGVFSDVTVAARGAVFAESLPLMVGHQVRLTTSGKRKYAGALRSVTTKAGKDGVPEVAAKVRGARDLDGLVGVQVTLEDAEPELDGVRDAVERLRRKAGSGIDSVTISTPDGRSATLHARNGACDRCSHPWSKDKNPKRKRDGHGRKTGECYVVRCLCTEFVEATV